MMIGYVRTDPGETTQRSQREVLNTAGCRILFEDEDVRSSAVLKPAYGTALRTAKPGDTIVISSLDRLSRSMGTLLTELQLLESLGLHFKTIKEGVSTQNDSAFFTHVRAFAQFSAAVSALRRQEHLDSIANEVGKPGRPALINDAQWDELVSLMAPPASMSVAQIASLAGVSRQAIYKRLKR